MPKRRPIKKGGQQPFIATDEQRKIAKNAAYLGLRDQDIARLIGCSESTVQRHFSDELADGRANGKCELAQTAMQMALSGEFPAMTIFMSKVRLGWKDSEPLPEKQQPVTFNYYGSERPARYNKSDKDGTTDE